MIFDPSTIIAASIAAVFALLGVIVANWWTFKQQIELYEREHKARQKELSLQRGEELYLLTEKFLIQLAKNSLPLTGVMGGRVTYLEYLDQLDKIALDEVDPTRMQMLVAVYFPSLLPSFQKLIDARTHLNDLGLQFVTTMAVAGQDTTQFANEYIKKQTAIEAAGDQFQKDIAEHLRQLG